MQSESLVKLVGSGNTAIVEEEWMRIIESTEASPAGIAEYREVLSELVRLGRREMAEELAWAAIEMMSSSHPPIETLTAAGSLLLAVGESEELRVQVVELYRAAYEDREGLEALLMEAGLEEGRPVRRALRTVEVCLALGEGDFLVSRDEDGAARVDRIDRDSWLFGITTEQGAAELAAVSLADRYEPAAPADFRVLRHFAPEELARRLRDDPAAVVMSICRQRGDKLDSYTLEMLLVPRYVEADEWKKWWSRTRAALKKCPNIKLEGRTPHYVSYLDKPIALEGTVQEALDKARDPVARLELIEKYLRECKARGQSPSVEALRRWYDDFCNRARRAAGQSLARAGLLWLIARRIGGLADIEGAGDGAVDLFKTVADAGVLFKSVESDALVDLACTCLVEARPDIWQDQLLNLLPMFPVASCDRAARRLLEAGRGLEDFQPIVQQILSSPVDHFEALLWLWDGPTNEERITDLAPVTILSRILRTLEESRRSDQIPKETARRMAGRARAVLSARKHERFDRCLAKVESGMAVALKTQIRRLDSLGRAVREDMLSRLRHHFPALDSQPAVAPWTRDDVLFVTELGLVRRQREIDHHVNVKMRDNARAIGEAAARGDLSENSEYKFALEERDLLRARLGQMNAEVAQAQILDPGAVPTEHVGIGTKAVFARVGDGDRYEMAFLGPWEANIEEGVYNYLAPLSQKILGMRVGDTVDFDHAGRSGTYELVAIENALAE